jgi:hypothetical protein
VRVRLIRIAGADLRLFDFDHDLTWYVFFLSPDEKIYGRYGGRDARDAEARLSLAGLRYAMSAALAAHRQRGGIAVQRQGPHVRAEDYPAAKRPNAAGCIHCHQVNEFRREALKESGQWRREDRWVYPLPENIGLALEVDAGNRVAKVTPSSPAERVGVRSGDVLQTLNGYPVASFADAQYALHKAPPEGRIAISWQRAGQALQGELEVATGWRKTNLTWRPSLLDLLPGLALYGDDLSAAEKKTLGLSEKRLAFRQQKPAKDAREAGVREGDIILGLDDLRLEMTMDEFLAHVRRNYLVGDRVMLNVLREGRRIDVPLTLR